MFIIIFCFTDIDIRFADERKEIIEVQYNGSKWRSVCTNHWTDNDAKVACRQLGLLSDGKWCTIFSILLLESKQVVFLKSCMRKKKTEKSISICWTMLIVVEMRNLYLPVSICGWEKPNVITK